MVIHKCSDCSTLVEIADITSHMKTIHALEVMKSISYVFECVTCNRQFDHWRPFRKHLARDSTTSCFTIRLNPDHQMIVDEPEADIRILDNIYVINNFLSNQSDNCEVKNKTNDLFSEVLASIAPFLIDVSINRKVLENIIGLVTKTFNLTSTLYEDFLEKEKSVDQIKGICKELKSKFDDISTEHKLLKYLKSKNLYQDPEVAVLKHVAAKKTVGTDKQENKMYHFPLAKTLKSFLEAPGVFKKVFDNYFHLVNDQGPITNVVQTEYWKSMIQDKNCPILPFLGYKDEYNPDVNVLGSRATVHKLCATYGKLMCCPEEYNSQLSSLFLLQLCHESDLKDGGEDAADYFIIEELNKLSKEGLIICINNQKIRLFIQLVALTGDNLTVNRMLGWTGGFNADGFCRICQVKRSDAAADVCINSDLKRTCANYAEDLEHLTSGIKRPCFWNQVEGYHCVTNPSADPMHDLNQGTVKRDLNLLLNAFIYGMKYFTLEELNNRILLHYYKCNANEPPLISEDALKKTNSINMSASEVKNFLLNFGLIAGDLIPEDDEY